jgi:hypothetical protein
MKKKVEMKPEYEEAVKLESPLSIVKMDLDQLESYVARLDQFIKDPGLVAIRICECCIQVS